MVAARRNVLIAALALLGGCRTILGIEDGVVDNSADDGPPLIGDAPVAGYLKPLTVRSPVQPTLDGFQLPVVLIPDANLVAHARADGKDIHFTQAGNELAFEIVSYDGNTGALEAWVLLPKLDAMNRIDLEYGGGGVIAHTATETWPAPVEAAWHFASSATIIYPDSAVNAHTAAGLNAPTTVDGIAGDALGMSANTILTAGDPANGTFDFAGSFSLSLWVRVTTSINAFDRAFYKGGSSVSDPGYELELGTGNWNMLLSDGMTLVAASFGSESEMIGQWVHLAGVVDRQAGTLVVYRNGQGIGTTPIPQTFASLANSKPLMFGNMSYGFQGLIDEARVYKSVKTGDWFRAEYELRTSAALALTVGPEEIVH